ncbi:MAG: alpha-methylacyl-CoA racemase [Candidatus Binatia bacterium]|nr:MAG: alpha-methylacyl-CoA racemase [Candidatus Binatia bacterium]
MAGPLEGIRVLELGFWVAGPAVGGILGDWGAEVVKVEPPRGDPFRGLYVKSAGLDVPINPPFELDNRGKRSVALDLGTPEGREIAGKLLERSDVFVTNLQREALERFGLDYETLAPRFPRLVYAQVTGYGERGPDRDRPAYDIGAFWSRAGVVAALTPEGSEPPYQRGGFGDHITAISAAAGVVTALFARERTGRGQKVSTSLLRAGIYVMGFDTNTALRLGTVPGPMRRTDLPNPLVTAYRAGDGRWFWLLGLEGDRHWPDLVRAVERPEWLEDPRFSTMTARREHARELIALLDDVFAKKTLAEWGEAFDRAGMWWAPVRSTAEVVRDPQAWASGAFVEVPLGDGSRAPMVSGPVDFSETPWQPRGPVPELGQHTEEVLLELGFDWEKIAELKDRGVIP